MRLPFPEPLGGQASSGVLTVICTCGSRNICPQNFLSTKGTKLGERKRVNKSDPSNCRTHLSSPVRYLLISLIIMCSSEILLNHLGQQDLNLRCILTLI